MIPAIAVGLIAGWLLVQSVAGRLPARLLSYRAGTLGNVPTADAPTGDLPPSIPAERVETIRGFIWPADGRVSQEFHTGHDGMDISNTQGTRVRAAFSGTVISCEPESTKSGYGNIIRVDNGAGVQTWYAHLLNFGQTKVGDKVRTGQPLAPMGSTGNSTGPHLHFEIHVAGVPVNPRKYIGGNP